MTEHIKTSPEQYYKQQLALVAEKLATANKHAGSVAWLRLVTILAFVAAVYYTISLDNNYLIALDVALLVSVFAILRRQDRIKLSIKQLERHIAILKGEEIALQGDISAFPAGNDYVDANHPFSFDLDIFGARSVYQLLNRTVTEQGADALAASLQQPYATAREIENRQELIKELATKPEYLHKFRVAGLLTNEEKGAAERIQQWLDFEDILFGKQFIRILTWVIPALSSLFLVLCFISGQLHPGLVVMLVINGVAYGIYKKKIKVAHYLVSESLKLIQKTETLLAEIVQHEFQHPELVAIKNDALNTLASIIKLRKLVNLFDSRQNGMVGPLLNALFFFDIACIWKLEQWRKQYKESLVAAFANIANADKYNSYANYTFNNPANIYPTIDAQSSVIQATNLRHPLMKKDAAVGNDCTLGKDERIYLLTGANMTGKSTFIRTIGVNLILAHTGVPVAAESLTVPVVKIFTSIRITDSIQDDVSYFKAELERLQKLMQQVTNTDIPYLVLLDEPLRGTNTADKQSGTTSVIKKLAGCNVIGIVATHDTGLCIMAEQYPGKISNYHFESEINGNQLTFDYKLKPGGSTSSNATMLIKMMGIID